MADVSDRLEIHSSTPDNGKVLYTRDEVISYLNQDFIKGNMSAKEFLDIMLDAAQQKDIEQVALKALSISFGDLRMSSMTASAETYKMISQGTENEKTQSITHALTPEHITILRGLITKTPFAVDPYLSSLSLSPQVASSEDMEKLREFLGGHPFIFTKKIDPEKPNYYPQEIFDVLNTLKTVVGKRPDLVDVSTADAISHLPERIANSNFYVRPSYDRGVSREKILGVADQLQHLIDTPNSVNK